MLAELILTTLDRDPERLDLLSFEHRTIVAVAIEGNEQITVVGGVELAAERHIPSRLQRRDSRADLLEDPKIRRVTNLRDRKVVVSGQS